MKIESDTYDGRPELASDDDTSPLTAYLASAEAQGAGICRFRRILQDSAAGVVEWAAPGGASLGVGAPLWERARQVRGLLPESRLGRPVFAIVRTSSECLVVVALPDGFVAGQIDFDLGVEAAAECLWEASQPTHAG